MPHRGLTAIGTLLVLLLGALPAAAYTPNDDAFAERHGGSGGRTATGVHPTGGAVRWSAPAADGDELVGGLQLDRAGHVLTFAATGAGAARMVAIDLDDGSEAWRTTTAPPVDPGCVAVALDGTIWAQRADGSQLLGIDAADGSLEATHPAPATDCHTGLQILPGNRLAYIDFCCSERLHVVDLGSGSARAMPAEPIRRDVLLTSPDGARAYVVATTGELLSINLATGGVLDRLALPGSIPFAAMGSSVVLDGGAVVMALTAAPDLVVRIDDDGSGGLSQTWSVQTVGAVGPRPEWVAPGGAEDDLVLGWTRIGGDDRLAALDAASGELVFTATVPPGASGGEAFASIAVDGAGNIVVPQAASRTAADGQVLYDVLGPTGIPIGRSPLDLGGGTGGLVIAPDGTLVIRTAADGVQRLIAVAAGVPGLVDIPAQVAPRSVGAGIVSLRVTGTIVADATGLRLRRGADTRRAGAAITDRRNPLERIGRFDLRGAAPGSWDLLVAGPSGAVTDTGLDVTVVAADALAELRVDLQLPPAIRNGRTRPASITVTNGSNIDAAGVPVIVRTDLGQADPRRLVALFDAVDADGVTGTPPAQQWSAGARYRYLSLPLVPAGASVTLPFLVDVPADAPAEGSVDVTVGIAPCLEPQPPAAVFAGVPAGGDPCFEQAATSTASGALDPATGSAAQCLALQLAGARAPRIEDGVVVIPDEVTTTDLASFARSCYVDAVEELGGVSHPVVTIFKAEAYALSVVTAYLDCALASEDGSDSGSTATGSSVDPNELQGPAGAGAERYLATTRPLDYRILFENLPDAAFAAQVVEVSTTLDADVDPTTVALGPLGWADTAVSPPPVDDGYETLVVPDGADHRVRISFSRDGATLTWRFETLSLTADGPPEDDRVGFLPPNTTAPEGDGFVSFAVAPAAGAGEGTVITATASIVFDTNEPIVTNTWSNTLDLTPPTTTLTAPTSPSASNTVTFAWSGTDATSGVARYLLDRLDGDGRPLPPTTGTTASLLGARTDTVTLRVRAVDGAGNVEPATTAPTASVTIAEDALDRLFGPTRIGTAVDISRRIFGRSGIAVLARADTYPDSLAGATLAHDLQAPLLLTDRDRVDASVITEMHRLGVGAVVVLGGDAAVGEQVLDVLRAEGFTVERIFGGDRFATAAAVAAFLPASEHAFLVRGRHPDPAAGWPDALLAAPWAAQAREPLLLVEGDALPPPTRQALIDRGITRVTAVGSTTAVPPAIVAEMQALGIAVSRIDGADRYDVGLATAAAAAAAGAGDPAGTWIATGLVFADALSAGAAVAATGGTLLLLDGLDHTRSQAVTDAIATGEAAIEVLRVAGGPAAIDEDAEAALRAALTR